MHTLIWRVLNWVYWPTSQFSKHTEIPNTVLRTNDWLSKNIHYNTLFQFLWSLMCSQSFISIKKYTFYIPFLDISIAKSISYINLWKRYTNAGNMCFQNIECYIFSVQFEKEMFKLHFKNIKSSPFHATFWAIRVFPK